MVANDQQLLKYLSQHLVLLSATFQEEKKDYPYPVTAFVLSAKDEWFLVTAGHVALDIVNNYMNNPEYCLKEAYLCDAAGYNAKYPEPIPYELDSEKIVVLGDEATNDFAIIHLSPYYKRLLLANGVTSLNEQAWFYQYDDPDCFKMLGVTKQMVSPMRNNNDKCTVTGLNIGITLHHVEHSPQRPNGIEEVDYARWYGYISLAPPVDDIKGISGAPIFAFKQTNSGEWKYWLVGVQSCWNPKSKAISACPAQALGDLLACV